MIKTNIIAEIGINAVSSEKGKDIEKAKNLINIAALAGVDYVKFQKRDPDTAVPESKKMESKSVPWRKEPTTYLQYKKDIEFTFDEYQELFQYAQALGVGLFASVWDIKSAELMLNITDIVKIPSAHVTNIELLDFCRHSFKFRILSTGMSTEYEIEDAVSALEPHVIMHTNSTYPCPVDQLNMGYIQWLKEKYIGMQIGYSNHYYGIVPIMASIYLGANWVEFHITENHEDWGSDQKASIEPAGVFKLVKGIRDLERAYQGFGPRDILSGEVKKRKDLSLK